MNMVEDTMVAHRFAGTGITGPSAHGLVTGT